MSHCPFQLPKRQRTRHIPACSSSIADELLLDTKVLSRLLTGPKETLDKWLTVVPISMPKCLLASRFSQCSKYLLQSPCWHPDSSQLLTPSPILDFSSLWASLSLTFHYHTIQPCHFGHVLAPLFFCLLFFPLSAGSPIPLSAYWPYLVPALDFFTNLQLYSFLTSAIKIFPSIIPWSVPVFP